MTEAAILKILFPPDGIVPVDRLDRMQSIRAHIAALLALSQINNSPTETSETRINSQEISRATTLRIVKLREQPNANGHRRTWKEVSEELGLGLSPDAASHRYKCYMAVQEASEQKKTGEEPESHHQAPELDNTVSVSNVLVPVSQEDESKAPPEEHPSDQAAMIPHNEDDFIQIQPLPEEKEDACNIDDIKAGFYTETARRAKQHDKPEQPSPRETQTLAHRPDHPGHGQP